MIFSKELVLSINLILVTKIFEGSDGAASTIVQANRQENGLMSREPHNSFSHTPKIATCFTMYCAKNEK